MKQNKFNITQLETMISRYFDCDLSDAEERQLREALATTSLSSNAIDEARFTMGFLSIGMEQHQERKRNSTLKKTWRIAAAAASIILVAGIGTYFLITRPSNECYAYVNGKKVTGDEQVMSLVKNDMSCLSDASTSIENGMMEQLSSMGEALD